MRLYFKILFSLFSEITKHLPMKKIKMYDLLINLSLIMISVIAGIIWGMKIALLGCYITGAWQLASMLFHAHYNCFTKKGSVRYYYHWLAAAACCCLLLAGILTAFRFMYFLLLVSAPLMAFYYTYICYQEVFIKMQRPLAILK